MRARGPGLKQLKRTYAAARRHYRDLHRALENLQDAQAYLPVVVLTPAIDLMFDKVEEAKQPYEAAAAECRAHGIRRVEGYPIHYTYCVNDLDNDECEAA